MMQLGKLKAVKDRRTFKLEKVITLPKLPSKDDARADLVKVPTPMFMNDKLGCCVISGRAHHTLTFEAFEQKQSVPITDAEIKKEYLKESGGVDSGLIMLESMKAWLKGWKAGGKTFNIYAFGSVNPKNPDYVRAIITLLHGANIGLWLPKTAQDQVGKIWTVKSGPGSKPGSWGGHCVYTPVYDFSTKTKTLTCVTWGTFQTMTWEFFVKYTDENYGVVDNRDSWLGSKSPVDIPLLDSYLKEVQG